MGESGQQLGIQAASILILALMAILAIAQTGLQSDYGKAVSRTL
jgi:hypothetical protein